MLTPPGIPDMITGYPYTPGPYPNPPTGFHVESSQTITQSPIAASAHSLEYEYGVVRCWRSVWNRVGWMRINIEELKEPS